MNSTELRALQAPFKERYKEFPEQALRTLSASGTVHFPTVTVQIHHTGPGNGSAGLHPLTGGDGLAACAAEMLLEALVGCAGVTFAAVCTAMEIPMQEAKLTASGEIDFRGTLGVSRDAPVGFQNVHLEFEVQSSTDDSKVAKAVQLAERYCVVAQTLKSVTTGWKRIS